MATRTGLEQVLFPEEWDWKQGVCGLMLNGEAYKTEKLSGEFKFQWQGDWDADSAGVRDTPSPVTSGDVLLVYRCKGQ